MAQATLSGGDISGTVELSEEYGGTLVAIEVRGLEPGSVHAIHVHEFGKCEGDFTSAGGHYNPTGAPHGSPEHRNHHVGDLGNISADAAGVAKKEVLMPRLKLDGATSAVGRSIIVHEKPDDMTSQPSGNAGARLACGVIMPSL